MIAGVAMFLSPCGALRKLVWKLRHPDKTTRHVRTAHACGWRVGDIGGQWLDLDPRWQANTLRALEQITCKDWALMVASCISWFGGNASPAARRFALRRRPRARVPDFDDVLDVTATSDSSEKRGVTPRSKKHLSGLYGYRAIDRAQCS